MEVIPAAVDDQGVTDLGRIRIDHGGCEYGGPHVVGEHEGRRYLSAETVDAFLESTGEGQALGWQTPDYAPPTSFVHTGFTGTSLWIDLESGAIVVVLSNRVHLVES